MLDLHVDYRTVVFLNTGIFSAKKVLDGHEKAPMLTRKRSDAHYSFSAVVEH